MAEGDGRAIWRGCDETADCPAVEHSSRCWRGDLVRRGVPGFLPEPSDSERSTP